LEPLERLDLPEGSEVVLTVVAVPVSPLRPAPVIPFDTYALGVYQPLTRREIYDDAG